MVNVEIDLGTDRFKMMKDIIIAEAQHADAEGLEVKGALFIILQACIFKMLGTIQFNHKLCR